MMALQWIEKKNKSNVITSSDCWAAVSTIKKGRSCKQDLLIESYQLIYALHIKDMMIDIVWVPAHYEAEISGQDVYIVVLKEMISPSDVRGQQGLYLRSWPSCGVLLIYRDVVCLPNVQIRAFLAALYRNCYITLFISGCFVLRMDKFLPHCVGRFRSELGYDVTFSCVLLSVCS